MKIPVTRHPCEGGDTACQLARTQKTWIPAFAGLAILFTYYALSHHINSANAEIRRHPLVDDFEQACLGQSTFEKQAKQFVSMNWTIAPSEFASILSQELVKPESSENFVRDIPGGGKYLAATTIGMARSGLSSRKSLNCFVRMWTDTFDEAREDFRTRINRPPDKVTDSNDVAADSWITLLTGEVVSFRVIKTDQGIYMVTISRFSKEPN